MPILISESPATRKSWSPEIKATRAGLSLAAFPLRFIDDEYDVPALTVPCATPGHWRLSLVRFDSGAAVALVDRDRGLPDGYEEIVYLAQWTLAEGQTCADVDVEVTRRTLVDGAELPEPTRHVVSPVLVLPRQPTAEERFDAIDAKTRARIAEGVVYKGVRCSLSIESQMRMLGAFAARDSLTYPIRWNSLDDASVLSLTNAADVAAFYAAGMAALRSAVDAGTAEKDQVRA